MTTTIVGALALIAWLGLEVLLRPPGASTSLARETTDRGSTAALVLGYSLAIFLPPGFAATGLGEAGSLAWAGVALAWAGVALRAWSMQTLGASYTRTLKTARHQELVMTGPYRWVRHPGYLGSIAVWTGAGLAFGSWLAGVAVVLVLGVAYAWRIRNEEVMLATAFGPEYEAYAARTAMLIPGVF